MSGIADTSGPVPQNISESAGFQPSVRKHLDRKRRHQKPRILFSCTFCRTRKLKCNRALPCDNCIRRDQRSSCHYDTERIDSTNSSEDLLTRLKFLEEKVQRLERQSTDTAQSTNRSLGNVGVQESFSHTPGVLFSGHGGTRYVDSGHWRAILNDIEEIGNDRRHTNPIDDVEQHNSGPELLLGIPATTDIRVLLAAIPPRHIADVLVERYFKSGECALIFLHFPTFYKEYEDFWANPLQVSVPWLAILYGVLTCGSWMECQTGWRYPSSPDTLSYRTYRTHCAMCLTSCNYTVPGRCKAEALVMYMGNVYLQNAGAKSGFSILLGGAIRLATLMGYHRDSRHYPRITLFEGEMRRRLWLFLRITDAVTSRQHGIPTVIQKGHGDTSLPRNLLDRDFGPNTTALPPSRPETECTPIAKALTIERVLTMASEIVRATSSMEPLTYDETIKLNAKIDKTRSRQAPAFQMQDFVPSSSTVSGIEDLREIDMALQRYGTEMVIQVTRCILHRQYLLHARSETKYDQFRWACLDAAQQIVNRQLELFQHILVRAKRHNKVWFPLSQIISDCLTAAMVICLEVVCQIQAKQPVDQSLINLLRESHQTWKASQSETVEASKAEDILAAMLELISSKWSEGNMHNTGMSGGIIWDESAKREDTEFPMGLVYDVLGGSEFDWVLWDFEMQQLNNPTVPGLPGM